MTKSILTICVVMVAVVLGAAVWFVLQDDALRPGRRARAEAARTGLRPVPETTEEAPPAESLAPVTEEAAAERSPLRAPEKELPGALYALLDPEGRRLVDAHVALCAAGAVLATGRTDEHGEFATEQDGAGPAKLLVLAAGWLPQVHDVPLTAVRHEVHLRPGVLVSGWIVVDGHAPEDAILLSLGTDRGHTDLLEELEIDRETIEAAWEAQPAVAAETETDGAFAFAGLPENWSGAIYLPSEYHLRNQIDAASAYQPNSLHLDRAAEGLRIDVVRLPVLSGRVVDFAAPEADAVPVAGAGVEPHLDYPSGDADLISQRWESTDAEGRFRIPLLDLTIEGGFLTIESPGGDFRRDVLVAPMELRGSHDLGDLALVDPEANHTLPLLVRSEDGEPISGAVAGTVRRSPLSAPSDEAGRTSLRGVIPGASTIVVYAAGWEQTKVDVPVSPPDELVVTMRRGTTLELVFRTPDGKPAVGVVARVSADAHPFRDEAPIALVQGYQDAGCTWYQTVRPEDGTVVVQLNAGWEGRVLLNALRPGLPLHLRVEGNYGAIVHELDLAPLRPEERRVVEIDLPRGPTELHGRVVNEAGAPISTASYRVTFTRPDSRSDVVLAEGTRVDGKGEFHVAGIYRPQIGIGIRAEGYVPFENAEFEVPSDELPVEFVLTPAQTVTVMLQDEAGGPVEGRVRCSFASGSAFGRPVLDNPGSYLLRGLPEHEVVIQAFVHEAMYEKTHDPLVPTLTFTVPVHEDVVVTIRLSGGVELDEQCYLRLLPTGDAGLIPRLQPLSPGFTGSLTVPSVVPGHYEAVVLRWHDEKEGEVQWEQLSARVPFVVHAEETTTVTIDL